MSETTMNEPIRARYVTDDRDRPGDEQMALEIMLGGNGDWYISVEQKDAHPMRGVRISTSGGASFACPGLGVAMADAYRAMIAAEKARIEGRRPEPAQSRMDLEDEIRAWRRRFPGLTYEFGDIVEKSE